MYRPLAADGEAHKLVSRLTFDWHVKLVQQPESPLSGAIFGCVEGGSSIDVEKGEYLEVSAKLLHCCIFGLEMIDLNVAVVIDVL